MKQFETVKPFGYLDIKVTDAKGIVKQEFSVPNTIVTTGKETIASMLTTGTGSVMTHMAVGSDNTTADVIDNALYVEVLRSTLDSTGLSTNPATTITYIASFTGIDGENISEAGIFDAGTAGTMLCRTTFTSIPLEVSDTLTINWNVVIS